MKKVLLASTALILSAGFAAAEVTVAGDGRMGVVYDEGQPDGSELAFNSRIRIKFAASGETDGGLAFGGEVRADNAPPASITSTITDGNGLSPGDVGFDPTTVIVTNANSGGGVNGLAGNVFVAYGGMKLTMGDIDSAAEKAVGDVSGVGYTNLGDLNETAYLTGGDDEGALFEYALGSFTVYASVGQPGDNLTRTADTQEASIAVRYTAGNYSVGLGYENVDNFGDFVIIGGTAAFGAATVKAQYGSASLDAAGADFDQYGISLDYVFGATTVTAFYRAIDNDTAFGVGEQDIYGLGAAYDLGGGASLVGGINHTNTEDNIAATDDGRTRADFGIKMTF